MVIDGLFVGVFLFAALIGSSADIRTREVPDWLNYGLIFAGIGMRLIYSVSSFDWSYLIEGVLGLAAFFGLACLMFYTGQWGGGDAKMLMGIGALIGLRMDWHDLSVSFIANVFLVGALYALVWAIALAITRRARFVSELRKITGTPAMVRLRKIVLVAAVLLLVAGFFVADAMLRILLFSLLILSLAAFYLWMGVKAVEKACMLKNIAPEKLTEGDWLAEEIRVGRRVIAGPADLGIAREQIAELIALRKKKKIRTVLVKEGIPFVPSFLLAFIASWYFGNLFLLVV